MFARGCRGFKLDVRCPCHHRGWRDEKITVAVQACPDHGARYCPRSWAFTARNHRLIVSCVAQFHSFRLAHSAPVYRVGCSVSHPLGCHTPRPLCARLSYDAAGQSTASLSPIKGGSNSGARQPRRDRRHTGQSNAPQSTAATSPSDNQGKRALWCPGA